MLLLPEYRQEGIFARAGLAIPASTLAHWAGACGVQLQPLVDTLREELLAQPVLHADEMPVAMLKPGHGKTHRAYLWSYCSTALNPMKAVVFDFAETRGGHHAEQFLGAWRGTLVCDDFSGYKALFRQGGTVAGCMAHARRKSHELWANHSSQIAADALHAWLLAQRERVPEGSATARAVNYSLGRWCALTRYLDDGHLPIDNHWVENQIRPIAINGHDVYVYLKDVLERLPSQPANRVGELFPHRWSPAQ